MDRKSLEGFGAIGTGQGGWSACFHDVQAIAVLGESLGTRLYSFSQEY